jgi:hypothetical protein
MILLLLKTTRRVHAGIFIGFVCAVIGLIPGASIGAGVGVGYEAGGQIGFILGALIGLIGRRLLLFGNRAGK